MKTRQESHVLKKIYHIKVDWETHQIFMKYRDKRNNLMAGPISNERFLHPGGLQRIVSTQILSFGVSSHPLVWII